MADRVRRAGQRASVIRSLTASVPEASYFHELAERRRPLSMFGGRPSYQLLRETFFDTSDGALDERGLTLSLRLEARGRETLVLSIDEGVDLQGVRESVALEAPVVGGVYDTLAGPSEVATRVREVVDPAGLRPQVALDIDREIRELRPRPFGRATHHIAFDEIVAHAPGVSRDFHAVTLTEVANGRTTLQELARRMRADHGIASDGIDSYRRVRSALIEPTGAPRPEAPHDVRVGLLILRDWEVGLVDGPGGLRLPSAKGSGEPLAKEFLRELEGETDDGGMELDLVGFATARRGGSDLEVWMHEYLGREPTPGLVWIPLTEVMERLGGPRLHDPGLVSSLLMLVRSETGYRLLRDAPVRTGPPTTLPPMAREEGVEPGRHPDDFLDLELSILEFNQRVLELAEDERVPLLERLRFLSIFSSNMDEFFVVRIGRLKNEVSGGSGGTDEGLTPEELLDLAAVRVRALTTRQYSCLNEALLPALGERGVRLVTWDDLDEPRREALRERFSSEIFPLLTPLLMTSGPGRSFPRLVSLGLALAVALRYESGGKTEIGYVPIPEHLERFVRVPGSDDVISIERLVGANAEVLFNSAHVGEVFAFRASRMGDVDIDEDGAGSLLSAVADEVRERPFKPIIRLEVEAAMPREMRAFLLKAIRDEQSSDSVTLTRSDIYESPGLLDPTGLAELVDLELDGCVYPKHEPEVGLAPDESVFDVLAKGDLLFHHPFHDFGSTVGRFLETAATDPDVVSIRLTLYRTGRRSPVVETLIAALSAGKDVSVFVELTARFDEESNIHWTHRLKEAGAQVVYGVPGYKTHAKTALVIRREEEGIRRYVHVGTGNYNAATARFYTDLGLLSAHPDLGADLNDFFNELIGGAGPPTKQFRRLLVAPHSLVQRIDRMIEREIEHAQAGRPARIQAKLNGLADRTIVRSLYRASQAGVDIDLIVRSICTLRPGVPALSEGIRVRSILGRFLEHSRIYYFENAGQSEYFIGSADWRARNLRRRVEVVAPVDDPVARRTLRAILDRQLADPRAWELRPDGVYERHDRPGPDAQEMFMDGAGG